MVSSGNFEVGEGRDGYSIDTKAIINEIKTALDEQSKETITVTAEGIIDKR